MGRGIFMRTKLARPGSFRRRGPGAVLCGMAVITLAGVGCASNGRRAQSASDGPDQNGAALRQRAVEYWTARERQDWNTLFRFLDPTERAGTNASEYAAWAESDEPFRILSHRIGDVRVHGELGWVQVDFSTALKKFPKAAPRSVTTWEKWKFAERAWIPVSRREVDSYPESPAIRSAPNEEVLRSRFEQTWRARRERDWPELYALCDPCDHVDVALDEFADVEGTFEYFSCEVHWVEAIGDRGRVNVSYEHKLDDPSLTKLQPRTARITENWVKYEGTWYRDLKRQ